MKNCIFLNILLLDNCHHGFVNVTEWPHLRMEFDKHVFQSMAPCQNGVWLAWILFNVFTEWLHPRMEFDESGIKGYIRECNKLGVIPVSYFEKHIEDRAFVMKHHGLGPLGAKAIAKPLEVSVYNTYLILVKLLLDTNSRYEKTITIFLGHLCRLILNWQICPH